MSSLEAALCELRQAAAEDGIRPEGPLGAFIKALEGLATTLVASLETTAAMAREHAEAERERMRAAVAMVEAQVRRVDAELRKLEINRQDLETKTISSLTDAVAAKLKEVLVIRERRWNQKARMWSWLGAGALALALIIGGYSWRTWQDAGAMSAYANCYKQAVRDPVTGKAYCPLDVVLSE